MGLLDKFKELLSNNKKNANFYATTLQKTYGESQPLEIALYSGKTPLANKPVKININSVDYQRTTDTNGIARLNINLGKGTYRAYLDFEDAEHNKVSSYVDVVVKPQVKDTRMEGTDINKIEGDATAYQCAVYDNEGRVRGNVDITINGVTYHRTANDEGLYKLNINLQPGKYTIQANFLGDEEHKPSSVTNSVVVNKKPEVKAPECTNPYNSTPHPTAPGCNGMGQNNSVYCAPSSVHKILYKFGIRDITQGQLASWMGTGSAGTSHSGIETGIAMVNNRKGTKLSIKWYNFSDLGWEGIGKIICNPNQDVLVHNLYRNQWGHYETINQINTNTGVIKVLNSLGSSCGSCYCGYVESRAASTFRSYISGISQKSIAVITKQ